MISVSITIDGYTFSLPNIRDATSKLAIAAFLDLQGDVSVQFPVEPQSNGVESGGSCVMRGREMADYVREN